MNLGITKLNMKYIEITARRGKEVYREKGNNSDSRSKAVWQNNLAKYA